MKKLLGIFAHPDDESFSAGGTIAKYAKAGWEVHLVCATRGQAGSSGPLTATGNLLGNIRERELQDAASLLGVTSVTFLDYQDGKLSQEVPGEIEDKLINLLVEFRPDVVLTFENQGISNHPDHIKISLVVTYAFQVYAKVQNLDHPDDPNPPKLYLACMPESVASYLKKTRVIPEESFGKKWTGVEDKRVAAVIDIKRFTSVKIKALRAHVSQTEDVERFLSTKTNPQLSQEYFILRMVGIVEAFMGKNDKVADRL